MADEFGPVEPAEKFGPVEPLKAEVAAPKKDPMDRPATAFTLGTLNKLAMGGGSSALALKDMLSSIDSRTGQKGIPKGMGPKDLYLSNKAFYDSGFDRLARANPNAEMASNVAYFVGPKGGGFVQNVARGTARGAGEGAIGGPSSIADNPEEVLKEAGIGAVGGGVGGAVGSAVGKVVEGAGSMARGKLREVLRRVNARAIAARQGEAKELASQIAKRREQGKDANAALIRLLEKDPRIENAALPTIALPQSSAPTRAARRLGLDPARVKDRLDASEKVARHDFDEFFDNPKQITQKVRPMGVHLAEAKQTERNIATKAVKDILKASAVGAATGEAVNALGGDRRIGWAIGGASRLWSLRNIAARVTRHPEALERLSKLKGIGKKVTAALGRSGGQGGAAVSLAVLAKDDPALRKALEDEAALLPGEYEPGQDEPDGLTYRKAK